MNEIKCECGHVNPHGTILCESCGKSLIEEEDHTKPLDMRYEGSARRSQTYNKTLVDKIWNFFSSVKVGVILIVITLIASAIGTILPQEKTISTTMTPSEFYDSQYGWFGRVYYILGFHHLFSSWWYLVLIALIGVSLVICSLDRVVPLYRALKNQRVSRHDSFLKRQRLFGITTSENAEQDFEKLKENLTAKRYVIREENGDLLAEKGRFSRWGPYVNHVGLIIFLIAAMLRTVPGMNVDETIWVREGETKLIPGTDGEYYIKNKDFNLEVYDQEKDNKVFKDALDQSGAVAKNYQTDVTLYKKKNDTVLGEDAKLEKVMNDSIRVNEPLKFDGYALYQMDYKLDELDSMTFALTNKSTEKQYGNITIDLYNPKKTYDLGNGYKVELMSYFPDFKFDENDEPTTQSRYPNNPAFIFKMITPEHEDGEVSFVAIKQTIEPKGNNQYKLDFTGIETKDVTALTVRKDVTLWIFGLGGLIFMVGVIQGAYWNHRRIWIRKRDQEIWVAAHTNKNWHGVKRELTAILDGTGIHEPNDQLQDQGEK
jgi:cytochrome c biogenesis protein